MSRAALAGLKCFNPILSQDANLAGDARINRPLTFSFEWQDFRLRHDNRSRFA